MKKYFLLVFGIFICMIMPKTVFAKSFNVVAGAGRSAVMNPSGTYYYTQWKGLSSDSLNILPIPYPNGDYYLMGSEYSFAITLTGEKSFRGHVTIPVAANTIYNYTMTNGLLQADGSADLHFGIDQNFGVYNMGLGGYNATWSCNTYTNNLGVSHNLCFYDIEFSFTTETDYEGAYNLNVAVLNTTGNRSAFYYSGVDSNGNGIEFPVNASGSQYSTVRPYLSMTGLSGDSSSPDNTEEILNGVSQASAEISQTIQESYENLVKTQEVCQSIDKNKVVFTNKNLNSGGSLIDRNNSGVTDFIKINSNSIITRTKNLSWADSFYACFYNINKEVISCYQETSTENYVVPPNADYVRFSLGLTTNLPQFSICSNGNQAMYDSFNDSNVNDSTSIASGLLEDAQITDKGLTGLVATVLDFINDIFDSTCSPLSFELPFVDTTLTLPCMSTIYTTYFPDLFNLYQLITTGFIAYRVIINLFDKVKKVQDPEYDKVEVLQL